MSEFITPEQLRPGLYIHLDLNWVDHPFSFGSFKLKSEEQIATVRSLGLARVRYDPAKSDARPLPPAPVQAIAPATPVSPAVDDAVQAAKRERQARLKKHRETLARVGKRFTQTAGTIRQLHQSLETRPQQGVAETAALVDRMVSEFLGDNDVAIHAIAARAGVQEIYQHTLNVAILSLMIARELKLSAPECALLGQGALYHDLGLADVPARILRNPDPLTAPERAARALHAEHGFKRAQSLRLAPEILDIVIHHHELADGSGYPHRLKGDAIAPLTRIAALVNQYDNLCNPANGARPMTPHESLSWMFAQQKNKFDASLMQVLIKSLGVYPPGTLVTLSNDAVCLVTAVNSHRPMRPMVVVYDARVPSHEPMVLDLAEETDLNITHALKPAQVGRDVLDYLGVRSRVSYFFDASEGAAACPAP